MSTTAIATRPYIGLRYFEERDAHLFYGRDEHVAELLGKVAQNRFVAVMGSSGCGKSSLVRAGLLPELRSGMIPKAGPRWKVVEFRPGRTPLQELATAIRSKLGVEQAQQLVEEGPLGIARAVAEAKLDEGTNVLVIADQFEEVFRFQREEASQDRGTEAAEECQALTRRLLDAASQPELPIYVLLVMRSDYLGECAQFPDLPERTSESLYLVPRLRRDQLQEAITAPVGGAIEPAVVQRLLGEVGSDPDQLPRLQHLLGRMWDRAGGGRMTMEHYEDAGGWEKGLEQHLEEVYTGLSVPQQTVCARVFQQLSELDKGRAVRRRAENSELVEVCGPDAPEVVGRFRGEGFVTPRENPVDITHECILREWPRLKDWLDRENRNARRVRELVEAAKDAGWRPGLTPEEEKPVRELAGLTLQNLAGWCDEAQPTDAWARRYVTTVDFETAYGYLQWSETRDKEQKGRELRRTRNLRIVFGLLLLGLAIASWVFYRLKGEAQLERAKAEASALRADASAKEAQSQKQSAEDSAKEAQTEKQAAEKNAAEATRQQGIAQENFATAERNAREAKARELAAFSTESLSEDPEKSILLGMQAVNATLRFGQPPVPAAQEALHQAILSSHVRLTLKGHNDFVLSAAWSPDGKRLATGSADQTAKVWDAASGQELLTLQGYTGGVWSVAWSPDGKRLATASEDQTAKVWDAASGQELLTLKGHSNIVVGVAWSPDGKRLATGSVDGTAKVWDAVSGQNLLTLNGHTEYVRSVAWSPDGKWLATASWDQTAKVWDAARGQELLSLKGHSGWVTSVAWSPDGKRLATGSEDETAKVWDAASGQELLTLKGHAAAVYSVAWNPDGKRLATGSFDHTAKVWDAVSGDALLTLKGHTDTVGSVAWSPDGKRLATGSGDKTAKVWDPSRQELLTLKGHKATVWSVAWSPDGKRLATGSGDKTAKVWDPSGQELLTLEGHAGEVWSVAWSPDGERLATGSWDRTARVWDAASGQELLTLTGHTDRVFGIAWSPDGKRLVTGSFDHTAKVWDAVSGQNLLTLNGHTEYVRSVAWSPDGKRLATGSYDDTTKVWDAASGQELLSLKGHSGWVTSVAWSPDGKRLATGSDDATAKVWDTAGGQELLTLQLNSNVESVAWSSDGKRLATGSDDATAKVWDAASGQELLPLKGHNGTVWSVAWSPDGKRVATGSFDHTAKVWDAASGQELLTLKAHNDSLFKVAWGPDGKRIATAGTVQIYALDIRGLLELGRKRVTRNLTANECKRYFQSQTCPPLP